MKPEDRSWAVQRTRSQWAIPTTVSSGGRFLQTTVETWYGFVDCYSQDGDHAFTQLAFVCGGRRYNRTLRRYMNLRQLAVNAGKFVRQIARENNL